MIIERARTLRHMIERLAETLNDATAYDYAELYAQWSPDADYAKDKRLRYNGTLYKVKQPHHSQADWTPDIATSLYEEVAEPGQGDTPDNPIPYNNNMELIEGKYYSQGGITYHCFRSTGTAVYNDLSDLVGIYVEVYG